MNANETLTPTPAAELKPLFATTDEAACLLRISPRVVRQLIATGDLPSTLVGGSRRVPLKAITAFEDRAFNEAS